MTTTSRTSIPTHVRAENVFDFDIYGDKIVGDDLHNDYARLHGLAPPVFWTPANGGHWIVTRYDLISEVVRDPEHFSASEMQIPRVENPPRLIPLSLDPPDNMPYRQMLMPAFSPRAIAAMQPKLEEFAKELVDKVADKGGCDFVEDIAARYPVGVFMRLMGMPWERLEEFRRIADNYFSSVGEGSAAIEASVAAITHEMMRVIEEHRAEPRDDMTSHLINAKIGDRPITENELLAICNLLFMAGLDTVTNAMSFGCRYVANHAELQARLRNDPSAIEAFSEEVIRLFGVVNTPRLVVKDLDKFGVHFRKGDMVLSMLPLAGWDDSKNDHPAAFDLDRKERSYLTFSTGPHLCLGHILARAEIKSLFREWFARIPEFRVDANPAYGIRYGTVMSIRSLPLRWTASAAH